MSTRDDDGSWRAEAVLCLAALIYGTPLLRTLPEVHSDEAWVLDAIRQFGLGVTPDGMTLYTGSLHVYLAWPFTRLLGIHIGALRLLDLLGSTAALWCWMRTVRMLAGPETALWCGALVASAVSWVFMARFAIEVHILAPLLVTGALLVTLHAWHHKSRALALLAGFLFAALVHNHLSQAVVPASFALAAVLVWRREALRSRVLPYAIAGTLLGLIPRAIDAVRNWSEWQEAAQYQTATSWWVDVPHVPGLLLDAWEGSFFFQRVAGEELVPVLPYPLFALAAVLGLRWHARAGFRPDRLGAFILMSAVLCTALVLPITRWLSASYFVVVLWLLPALPVLVASSLLTGPHRRTALASRLLLGAVVVLNLGYGIANYYVAYARTGGRITSFKVGERLYETSAHFARVDKLQAALLESGVRTVLADLFIVAPLLANDVGIGLVRWDTPRDPPGDAALVERRTALVYYNGPTARGPELLMPPQQDAFNAGEIRWVRMPLPDPNFVAFLATRAGD